MVDVTNPTLDNVLIAFSDARRDLVEAESMARRFFTQLEDCHREIRDKRARVAELRKEVIAKLGEEAIPEARP